MANDRRRSTRKGYLRVLTLDTAIAIPDGQQARAQAIEMEASAKAMSGDLTPTAILAAAYPEGWERDLFTEQLDRKRPPVEQAPTKVANKPAVQELVYEHHIATATNAHRAIVAFRQKHEPAPAQAAPLPDPVSPDLSGVIAEISDRVADKLLVGLSVRPASPPVEAVKIRKPRQPARKIVMHGVEIPERQKSVADGIVEMAKNLLGDTETAERMEAKKGPSWMAELYKAVVLSDRMVIEKDHPELIPMLPEIRAGGAHLVARREASALRGKPVSLNDAAGMSQTLRNYVVGEMDNGATETEILEFLRHTFDVSEENEGWPRFLIKSAGLTLVAGVYTVQTNRSMH